MKRIWYWCFARLADGVWLSGVEYGISVGYVDGVNSENERLEQLLLDVPVDVFEGLGLQLAIDLIRADRADNETGKRVRFDRD